MIIVIKMLYIVRDTSQVHLSNITTYTGVVSSSIATLTNFNSATSSTSSNNLLAYRPNYNDFHSSGLAAFFVNIEQVFPCNPGAICSLFTHEEDGFRNGRAVINAADGGNNFPVFGRSITTFGFAFSGCSQMTTSCFPISTEYTIVCLLPRNRCG